MDELIAFGRKLDAMLKQAMASNASRKTVIVHPQLSKDQDGAQSLASNWEAREQQQLLNNIQKVVG